MSAAGVAYLAALNEIARIKEAGEAQPSFFEERFRALEKIPPELAEIKNAVAVDLRSTKVADLTPLRDLTRLKWLSIADTPVRDLTPIKNLGDLNTLNISLTNVDDLGPISELHALRLLYLSQTNVLDLAPVRGLTQLGELDLRGSQVRDLTDLRQLTRLQVLELDDTEVDDIDPLRDLTSLRRLTLSGTEVKDLSPLIGLQKLRDIFLDDSAVNDLRPITGTGEDGKDRVVRLGFSGTPAATASEELARLSRIDNPSECAARTLEYLKTLPPYPEPWLDDDGKPLKPESKAKPPPDPFNSEPLTVTALLDAQDLAGWRFSPSHGAMVLYVQDLPTADRQAQLAKMARERSGALLDALGNRRNASGIRGQVAREADRFAAILDDDSRSLSLRSLELWGSLISLGSLLDENDAGRRDGRDPLDLLTGEGRAALATLLGVASNLVRSFPEARELDDEHQQFRRTSVSREMILALLQEALRTEFVDASSTALMQHVARLPLDGGPQSKKAETATVAGGKNLVLAAALTAVAPFIYASEKIADGILKDIGKDIGEHYELGEKSIAFLEAIEDKIEGFLAALPPDEAAILRSELDEAERKIRGAGRHGGI